MSEKKLIVLIDDDYNTVEVVKIVLEEKDFEVQGFKNFEDAKKFIDQRTPDLIISDLIGHDDCNGIEFYIRHIMQKKVQFAIWTGSLDLSDEIGIRNFSLFLDGMPKDFRITYDPVKALEQHEIDLMVEDFKNNHKSTFPVFSKPGNLDEILKYFNLGQYVILYMGSSILSKMFG